MTEAEFREQFIRDTAARLMPSVVERYGLVGTEAQAKIAYHDATALYVEHRQRFPEKDVPSPKPVGRVRREGPRYALQNRYQDSGWENLNETFDHIRDAVQKASDYSRNSICYGMVRVVDLHFEKVIIEFPAGVEPK